MDEPIPGSESESSGEEGDEEDCGVRFSGKLMEIEKGWESAFNKEGEEKKGRPGQEAAPYEKRSALYFAHFFDNDAPSAPSCRCGYDEEKAG